MAPYAYNTPFTLGNGHSILGCYIWLMSVIVNTLHIRQLNKQLARSDAQHLEHTLGFLFSQTQTAKVTPIDKQLFPKQLSTCKVLRN